MADTAVIIGVGASEGLGAAIARRFARGGMQVVIAGRSQDRLAKVASEINADEGTASYCVTDATQAEDLDRLLEYANGNGKVTCVVFNVGNNQPLPFSELSAGQFEQFWRVCTLSGFIAAKAALPMLEQNGGSLLFTGASASMRGRPNFAHFGAAKAGLRNLAQALAKDYGPRGVHVGHVVVDGVINGEMVRTKFGEYLDALGEDGSMEPDAIAEDYWFMHTQPRNTWTFEVDVRPYKETW
jgi:NAD(P)-dependent dehydrogenase (short-subunit alcohol dehydrogenase family)